MILRSFPFFQNSSIRKRNDLWTCVLYQPLYEMECNSWFLLWRSIQLNFCSIFQVLWFIFVDWKHYYSITIQQNKNKIPNHTFALNLWAQKQTNLAPLKWRFWISIDHCTVEVDFARFLHICVFSERRRLWKLKIDMKSCLLSRISNKKNKMNQIFVMSHYIVHTKIVFLYRSITQQVYHLIKNVFLVIITSLWV